MPEVQSKVMSRRKEAPPVEESQAETRPKKLEVKEGPNRGAVFYADQAYMIDPHNKLWPLNKKQLARPDCKMRRYNPFVQGIPDFETDIPVESMDFEELKNYVRINYPKLIRIPPGMTRPDLLDMVLAHERQMFDVQRNGSAKEDSFEGYDNL